jgi:lysophospholipase L1-like esterase
MIVPIPQETVNLMRAMRAESRGTTVDVSGYSTSGNDGEATCSTPGGSRSIVSGGHMSRIRRPGTVTSVKVYFNSDWSAKLAGFWVGVVRWSAANTFVNVAWSEDVKAQVTGTGWVTITPATPLACAVGDCIAISYTLSGANTIGVGEGIAGKIDANRTIDYQRYRTADAVNRTAGASVDYAATSPAVDDGASNYIVAQAPSPIAIVCGDSFSAGRTNDTTVVYSHIEGVHNTGAAWTAVTLGAGIADYLRGLDSALFGDCMCHGVGSTGITANNAASWLYGSPSLLQRYVLDYQPRMAIISIGFNDTGATNAQFQTSFTNLTAQLLGAGILPVYIGVLHHVTGNAAGKAKVRDFNRIQRSVCAKYGVPMVDAWTLLGSIDDMDVRTDTYGTAAEIHPNAKAYSAIARAIAQRFAAEI